MDEKILVAQIKSIGKSMFQKSLNIILHHGLYERYDDGILDLNDTDAVQSKTTTILKFRLVKNSPLQQKYEAKD